VDGIIKYIKHVGIPLVEFTGGEPLLQMDGLLSCVFYLLRDTEYTVLVETNGSEDISPLMGSNPKLHIIMDIKMPSSGEQHSFHKENIELLNPWDEVKMVCSNYYDIEYAKRMLNTFNLPNPAIHAVDNGLMQETIVNTIIEEKLPVRFGIQLHKLLNIA
jgi:7-carboxy-7-deazaguanine synthase